MANKIDIVNEQPKMKRISSEQIEELAQRENLIYISECSAKTDTNIRESIEALIAKVHEVQSEVEE